MAKKNGSGAPADTGAWRNRIIGEGFEAPEQLLANPQNWRVHPKAQQDALASVMKEVGWVTRVIVNKRTNHVLDGHLRVAMCISDSLPLVPVTYVDLSPEEELLMLATLDPLSAMAVADSQALGDLIKGLGPVNEQVDGLLKHIGDLHGIFDGLAKPPDGGREELDALKLDIGIPETEAKQGEVWALGHHSLVVADVVREADLWSKYLKGKYFAPYGGPMVLLTVTAEAQPFLVVHPDPLIAGHIIDRYKEAKGPEGVRRG